jgi:hypothetical protein
MQAAEQVHGVGKVAAAMRTARAEQTVEVRMASAAFTHNSGKLRFGNADRLMGPHRSTTLMGALVVDGSFDRHSSPLG